MKWGKELFGHKPRRVYLDHAASTSVDSDIQKLMLPYLSVDFHNPSALYKEALQVRAALETAREQVAQAIKTQTSNIIFTSGATEANQLVINGVLKSAQKVGIKVPEIIISATEHPSIRNLCQQYQAEGLIILHELPVCATGQINVKELRELITSNTVLVSVHFVNNEIGSLQPLREIAKTVRWSRKQNKSIWPYLHTDAVQAAAYFDINVMSLGVDFLTLSSQKIYGPKGVGFLYRKPSVSFEKTLAGGGQEDGYRSGTENVPAIIGGAAALAQAQEQVTLENKRVAGLREWFKMELAILGDLVIIHGSEVSAEQSPHIINFTIPGINGELLVIELDHRGVLCAARAACSTDDAEASHVLAALYRESPNRELVLENGSVRFSFGKSTTKSDLRFALNQIRAVIKKYLISRL